MNNLSHIGIIMDGNRRWARQHKLQTVVEGHRQGTKRFIDLCSWCIDEHIPYVTVYAFSTENWDRSQEEVQGIFSLMEEFFRTEIDTCIEKGVKLKILGSRARLKDASVKIIEQAEERTAACVKLNAQIAINYGGRDEIIRALRKLYEGKKDDPRFPEALTEKEFEQYLDTGGIPEMDLVIRTGAGGRKRLSGFFPWQSVYAELVFLDTLWPDFSKQDLAQAIDFYQTVQRNRGK
ncbi:MAG: di-trans,poly-cis-decaprenylcistransferase [Spirochaetaceae bacterium]|nr:di-trans,poly-cis-decaprenylcistransferase [Spirochaetaceae bacterium]